MKVTYKRNFGNYERFGEDVESEDAVSNECFRSDEQDVVQTTMTTSAFEKFRLLSWKNWTIQSRHWVQTIFEVLIPVLCCSVILLIRGLVEVTDHPLPFFYNPVNISLVQSLPNLNPPIRFELLYSPPSPILDEILARATLELGVTRSSQNNALDLENILRNEPYLAGIQFDESLNGATTLPNHLNYAVRFPGESRTIINNQFAGFSGNWQTDFIFNDFSAQGPRNRERDDGGVPPGYNAEGFLAIQIAIERAFISMSANIPAGSSLPQINLQRYPYPEFVEDQLLTFLQFFIPFFIIISFFYVCINNIKYITVEKERQLKEAMKIMGLPNWLHWTAWFTKCMLFLMITITIITIIFKLPIASSSSLAVFTNTHWSVLWFFLFMYSITIVTFCFMFTVFFSKANTAAAIGGLAWFLIYFPFAITAGNYDTMSLISKLGISIFSNSGMSFGFMLITQWEGTGFGLQWNNLFSPVSVDDDLSVGYIMLMFIFSSVLYMLITLYVEKVFPGEFGVPEKWYFLFTKSYWSGGKSNKVDSAHFHQTKNSSFEDEPEGKHAGIQIRDLRKVFENKKAAVKGLNLNMYEDQITVLLGHNGAGKTTTMSMLTGMFPPTSGTAVIDGSDIKTNIDGARQSLGLCPQHNILFDELTVKEHIIFFSRLKGMKGAAIKEEIRKYVDLLDLTPKKNKQSHTLSGGMKRKLSVGIALCGNSKVVLIDEASSGMDPAARRALWDLLIQEKKGRTILLSTHFMDEADVLGDRIAIMAEGELKAVGSSFFLKKRFGVGYRLVCVKNEDCKPKDVTVLLKNFIPSVEIETDIGTELSYILEENYSSQFKDIFSSLENSADELKISSYGISLTTLEEVFLKVGTDSNALESKIDEVSTDGSNSEENNTAYGSTEILDMDSGKLLTGVSLFMAQVWAMFLKKYIYTKRNWILLVIQNAIPLVFIVMTMLVVADLSGQGNLGSLKITMASYAQTVTVLQSESFDTGSLQDNLIRSYTEIIQSAGSQHTLSTTTTPIQDFILGRYAVSVPRTNMDYMFGASITNQNITAWFNNQALHTIPLTINIIHNALLRALAGNGRSITVTNSPLPFTVETSFSQLEAGNNLGFQLAFNTGFAMAFVSAMFVMFYIKERVSRSKLLQLVSGANKVVFWMVSFVFDYIQFFIMSILFMLVLAAYQQDNYSTFEELWRVFIVFLVFGFAMLPFTYLLSFFFDIPSTGLSRLTIIYIITGIFAFMAYFIMSVEALGIQNAAKILGWIFLIFPHFSLSQAMSNLNVRQSTLNICKSQCQTFPECTLDFLCKLDERFAGCCETSFFTVSQGGIGRNLIAMAIIGVTLLSFLFVKEYRILEYIFYKGRGIAKDLVIAETEEAVLDSDVKAEKDRIKALSVGEITNSNLVLKNVTKFYGNFMAVNQLCVGVKEAECFGLLGVNGAGKTSTFKMLTGDEIISSGDAFINGISIKNRMDKIHKRIGYCPQFDALLEDLTGRETLKIFCLLRGVPKSQIHGVSTQLATELNFIKHMDKQVKAYSGGNKRKLSTALTLIGDPTVIYLDEPTSGMDPGARRHLWNMVIKARSSGKSVILTSHSMEECEALCTRLAIMVNGEFKCLGSTQHLKNKFSKGYILTIKIGTDQTQDQEAHRNQVKMFVLETFPGANLKEEYLDILTYHIPKADMKWSTMFDLMESAKARLHIDDYSLGQTSLEQVFLFFTKYQRVLDA